MAIQTINATIQMRHGREEDFDPDQMVVGEWAISEDTRYIRMCVSQGVCVRIALYNAFEGDMEEIIKILEECRTIQEIVEHIQAEIGHEVEVITTLSETARNAANTASQKASEAAESANSAGASADTATQKANDAKTSADSAADSKTRAGVYADLAQESVENASGYATTASEKATEASQSAIAASGHADRSGVSADSAADSALEAESYAHGDTGTREGENTDNALYYKGQAKAEADRAKAEADRASGIVGIGIATADKAGIVKPDGKTLTVDPDGTLHSQAGTVDYNDLENRPSVNGVTLEGNKTLSELGIQPEGDYAPIESPVLTGTPKAPTPPENTNNTQIATTAFVKTLISNLINGAPETLDTLKEIADALGKNDDVIKALNAAIGNKVDKVAGKGLSANDFTTAEKNKLSGIAADAEANVQSDWNVSDVTSDAFIKNKPTIPTKTSQLTNDSGYKTTDNDTWKQNTKISEGYVPAGNGHTNQVWGTDANGNPMWREETGKTPINNLLATVPGSPLDATQGKKLKDELTALNNNLGGYSFGETADGKPGYRKPGADTVIPFSSAYTYKTVNLGTYKAIRDGVAYLFFWSYASTGTYDGIIFTTTGSSKRIGYQSYNGQQSFLYQFNLKSGQTITTKAGPEYITSSAGTLIYPDGMF